jgi:ribonuclease P protein component
MTRSADFGTTVKQGVRAVQPDLVVHARRDPSSSDGPQIGLIVTKAIGGAVERHRVARQLRHVVRASLSELGPADRIVIRALPGSRGAKSVRLQEELGTALARARQLMERNR